MGIRKALIIACAGMLPLAGHPAAGTAEELPVSLASTGTVCEFSETDRSARGEHGHGLDNWKLKAGKTRVAIHKRWSGARYIDVLWSWPNELQDPDLLIVNRESNPILSKEQYGDGCKRNVPKSAFNSGTTIPDFVFGFAIHPIRNKPGSAEPVSPHAIVFLPINTGQEPVNSAQEFQILLFHMEQSSDDCPVAAGEARDQCMALWELRDKWLAAGQSTAKIEKEIVERIRKILLVDTAVPETPLPWLRNNWSTYFLVYLHYHNGVIHGTF